MTEKLLVSEYSLRGNVALNSSDQKNSTTTYFTLLFILLYMLTDTPRLQVKVPQLLHKAKGTHNQVSI